MLLLLVLASATPEVTVLYAAGERRLAGAHVLFHDAEGRLLGHERTDPEGLARFPLPAGGMVTALVEGGSEAGGPAFYTVTDVGAGELIPMGEPRDRSAPSAPPPPLPAPPAPRARGRRIVTLDGLPAAAHALTVEHAPLLGGRRLQAAVEPVLLGAAARTLQWPVDHSRAPCRAPDCPEEAEDLSLELVFAVDHETRVLSRRVERHRLPPQPIRWDVGRALLPRLLELALIEVDPARPLVQFRFDGAVGEADMLAVVVTWNQRGGEWALLLPPAESGLVRLPEMPAALAELRPARVLYRPPEVALIDVGPIRGYAEARRQRGFHATVHGDDRPLRLSLSIENR